ncbi:FadR/GntR family transcriptional regulator [Tropicimonas isoalkanivorans]|uniref:DNA-binding transcriptional regulator, FadR family n=1 Tax=Tropicimonas isoalkanivorans TaxID=441112 RepID=A0A1I1Q5D3_9RHOB|nr:FadR/GntR family transcriptional regulator [Tropicimonas isoalkanivorans]SFD17341.1 DNA-binding transcriptional regulator, FadR family [Tropicimonas isoalkanivorans]
MDTPEHKKPHFDEALKPASARDLVARKIASLIATGALSVGDELPSERELAVSFNISRSSVRSGLQFLAAKGVLSIAQGVKTRVISADVTPDTRQAQRINAYSLEDVETARTMLEDMVVRSAALRIDDATIAKLEEMLDAQFGMTNDPIRFLVSDRGFHLTIYEASGNPVLTDFVADLYGYEMTRRRQVVAVPGVIEASCREHAEILDGLRARDPAAAGAAFARHLRHVYATTRSLMTKGDIS